MRVVNTTTLDTALLRDVIRFVCPPGVAGFDVRLSNCSNGAFKGRAYPEGSSWHDRRATWFINLYIGPAALFPRTPRPPVRSGYLPTPWLRDQTEALVYLCAHELRHLWQGRVPRGRRVWGARGQYSERDTDAYAIRMLRAWRRETPTWLPKRWRPLKRVEHFHRFLNQPRVLRVAAKR